MPRFDNEGYQVFSPAEKDAMERPCPQCLNSGYKTKLNKNKKVQAVFCDCIYGIREEEDAREIARERIKNVLTSDS